jgi:hypothetical protein
MEMHRSAWEEGEREARSKSNAPSDVA